MPRWTVPIVTPPIRFTAMMISPAIASPFTNFMAPSIAPYSWLSFSSLAAPLAGLRLVDLAGAQVRVDAHLLARQRVQREPRADLGHALGTLRDHHELHDRDDQEDDEARR